PQPIADEHNLRLPNHSRAAGDCYCAARLRRHAMAKEKTAMGRRGGKALIRISRGDTGNLVPVRMAIVGGSRQSSQSGDDLSDGAEVIRHVGSDWRARAPM